MSGAAAAGSSKHGTGMPDNGATCRDLAQQRLGTSGRPQQLGSSFFMRMDGTKAFYFSEARYPVCACARLCPTSSL